MYKLIKSKAIIDGTGNNAIQNGCMLILNGIIEKIGSLKEMKKLPSNVKVIDFTNYYLMPGLIDCHTHLSIIPSKGDQNKQVCQPAGVNILRSISNIYKDLKSGVTTMRIMGEEHYIDTDIKDAINEHIIQGPQLLVSGKALASSNSFGLGLTASDGKEEVRKLSRQNFAKGTDHLKMFVTGGLSGENNNVDSCSYAIEEIRMAVEEAERAGKYVAAHAHGGRGLDLCIQAGVRTIEHAAYANLQQVEEMIKRGLWIIGTFSILFHPEGIEKSDFNKPTIKKKVIKAREVVEKNFKWILKSGVNLALGTDSMHGLLSYEAECLVNFGATNMQAILAVTKNAAKACKIDSHLGTLEKGKIANFIVLPGDPLKDIKYLKHVKNVYINGKKVI